MEGCSWNIPFIWVIAGDNLLATISPGANLHPSPRTDSAPLVCGVWKCGGVSLLFHSDSGDFGGFVAPGDTQLAGCAAGPWGSPHPPGSAWLGSIAWMVSSSEVFFALCFKAAQFLLLFMLQHLPSYTSGYWHEEASLKK